MNRIVIVGASLAGLRTIEALRRGGYRGEIIAVGDEPHMPYDRPPLSKQFLRGEWDEEKISLGRQGFDELDVEWRLGVRAESLDAGALALRLSSGGQLSADGLVIATGARARRLPFGGGLQGVHMLRDLADANALRAALAQGSPRVVVVGGGFIGMEAAASARELGLEVTVVEPLEQPLLRGLGPVLGEYVRRRHEGHGVSIRCGVGVSGFEGEGRVGGVTLADGSRIAADVVIVGIGIEPNVEWLEGSGLEIDDGVVCDATGHAGAPGVVAVGDVARWLDPRTGTPRRHEHWTSAVEQAGVAAARLLGGEAGAEPLAQVPYVWSDQFEMRIAIAGAVRAEAEMHVGHGSLDEDRWLAIFGEGGKLTGAVGMRRPRQLQACRDEIAEGLSFEAAKASHA